MKKKVNLGLFNVHIKFHLLMSDDFFKFQNDKNNFEFEKTLILQKDEVKRLKDELRLIYSHINESKLHFSQIISISKKKAKSLKKEIKSIPISTSIIESNLISSHTKLINKLKHEHHENLKAVKMQYSKQAKSIKISETTSQFFFDENADYDQLNDEYICQNFRNTELYELEIQSKISVLNNQIAQQLLKSEDLQEQIDELKEIINKEHQQSSSFISIKNLQDSKKQQNQQIQQKYQADIQKIENKYKNDEINEKKLFVNELDQLRQKISQARKRSQELKVKIDAKDTDSSIELNQSMQSLSSLQDVYQKMQEVSSTKLIIEKEIHISKKIMKQAAAHLKISVDDLIEIQKEHDSLLEEIKRLDFMIYGRRGKFQQIFKIKKRNHWIG